MKKKTPKIMRLFMVLALVAGIVSTLLVPASPVSAVTVVGFANVPTTTGAAAQWTITFTNGAAALVAGVDTISVTFPTGSSVPSTISGALVTVGGTVVSASGGNTTVAGNTLTLITPVGIAAAPAVGTVVVSQLAGVKNPNKATAFGAATVTAGGPYIGRVATSLEPGPVAAGAGIAVAASVFASPGAAAQGGTVNIIGAGFTANSSISLSGGVVSGGGTTDATGAFTISGTRSLAAAGVVTATDGDGNAQATAAVGLLASITASPTTVKVQDLVTLEGRAFTVGSTVAAGALTVGGAVIPVADAISGFGAAFTNRDNDGGGTLDDFRITFRVPSATGAGTRNVTATDAPGGATASTTITVAQPTITIDKASGPVGTLVTVTGSNFPAAAAPAAGNTITVGGVAAVLPTLLGTDTSGSFTTTFNIPAAAVGANRPVLATVVGPTDGAGVIGVTVFTVTSPSVTLTLTPNSGPRGTTVTVTGSGYTLGAGAAAPPAVPAIAIGALTIGGAAWNAAGINSNADGTLVAGAQVVPAAAAYGSNTVIGLSGAAAGATAFTVTQPTIAVAQTSAPVGGTLTVTGSGWVANGVVFLTRGGAVVNSANTDASGNFTGTVSVPAALFPGPTIVVIGANDGAGVGNVANTVPVNVPGPAIALSATTAAPGASIVVTGTGWLPITGVTALTVGGIPVLPATPVIADATGNWTASFTVPGLLGAQTVLATQGGVARAQVLNISAAAVGGAVAPATALASLINAGSLELASSFSYTTGTYQAFVPGLPGNVLALIQPNSVIILTLKADATVVVSGVAFPVKKGVPTPMPVGAQVTISVQ